MIPQRKPNRLKNFNYSSVGYYYVTICTKNRECWFGEIVDGEMILNEIGNIVQKCWFQIPQHYQNVSLDEFIVMPNHIHGIIIINKTSSINVGTIHELSLRNKSIFNWKQRRKMLLPKIIGFFKMNSSKTIHQLGINSFQYQRSFYDHIIRNEQSLNEIRKYIQGNPINWDNDKNNFDRIRSVPANSVF